jgi:hypothetical protein
MRELIKSMNSYALAMSLFGFKEFQNLLTPADRGEKKGPATKAMDHIVNATRNQFGPTLDSTFKTMDAMQRSLTDAAFYMMFPFLMLATDNRHDRRLERETERDVISRAMREGRSEQEVASGPQRMASGRKY